MRLQMGRAMGGQAVFLAMTDERETPPSEPDWWADQDMNEGWIQEQMQRISKASPLRSGLLNTNDTQQEKVKCP